MLRLNGYPSNMISGTLNRESHNSQAPQYDNSGPKWRYLKISYISDRIDYRITKLFNKEGIPVSITHENTTLRHVLNTRCSNPTSCWRAEYVLPRIKTYVLPRIAPIGTSVYHMPPVLNRKHH